MTRTPGLIIPSAYSSKEELEKDLKQRSEAAGFTPFEDFVEHSDNRSLILDKEVYLEHYGKKGMQ